MMVRTTRATSKNSEAAETPMEQSSEIGVNEEPEEQQQADVKEMEGCENFENQEVNEEMGGGAENQQEGEACTVWMDSANAQDQDSADIEEADRQPEEESGNFEDTGAEVEEAGGDMDKAEPAFAVEDEDTTTATAAEGQETEQKEEDNTGKDDVEGSGDADADQKKEEEKVEGEEEDSKSKPGESTAEDTDKKDKPDEQKTPHELTVSGLSYRTTALDLKRIFGKYCKVVDCKVVQNHRTRPRAYLTIASSTGASRCIKHLHRTDMHGRRVWVEDTKHDNTRRKERSKEENKEGAEGEPKENGEEKKDEENTVKEEGEEKTEVKEEEGEEKKESETAKEGSRDEKTDRKPVERNTDRITAERDRRRSRGNTFERSRDRRDWERPRRSPIRSHGLSSRRDLWGRSRHSRLSPRRDSSRMREMMDERDRRHARLRRREEEEKLQEEEKRLERERAELLRLKADKMRIERQKIEREKEMLLRDTRKMAYESSAEVMKRKMDTYARAELNSYGKMPRRDGMGNDQNSMYMWKDKGGMAGGEDPRRMRMNSKSNYGTGNMGSTGAPQQPGCWNYQQRWSGDKDAGATMQKPGILTRNVGGGGAAPFQRRY